MGEIILIKVLTSNTILIIYRYRNKTTFKENIMNTSKQELNQIITRFEKLAQRNENKPKRHTLCNEVVWAAESCLQQINLARDLYTVNEYYQDVQNAIENCYQQEIISNKLKIIVDKKQQFAIIYIKPRG